MTPTSDSSFLLLTTLNRGASILEGDRGDKGDAGGPPTSYGFGVSRDFERYVEFYKRSAILQFALSSEMVADSSANLRKARVIAFDGFRKGQVSARGAHKIRIELL